jgi:probable phosphoglycerate mutase
MLRLVLVRHSESMATVNRIVGGPRSCTGLSDLGRRQAEALRDRLARTGEIKADVLLASGLPRAAETAKILAAALGGLDVVTDDDLREHDPGPEFDGVSWDVAQAQIDPRQWESDPYLFGFPGGETVAAFQLRAATALHHVVAAHPGQSLVVVTHGGVIDTAVRSLLGLPMVGGFSLWTVNASLTELLRADEPGAHWVLLRYNDAAHLEGLPRETPSAVASGQ